MVVLCFGNINTVVGIYISAFLGQSEMSIIWSSSTILDLVKHIIRCLVNICNIHEQWNTLYVLIT